MVIKKLNLTRFGKFNSYEIDLKQGINLIYGRNEAGKSTIQKFIEGVFYGFYNRAASRRIYSPDYEKYFPWGSPGAYEGAIVFEVDNKPFRIFRNFYKGNDEVIVQNEKTGQDITSKFEYNGVLKIYDPAPKILGISHTTFINTLCIPQLGCKTGSGLGAEVGDKILSMSTTADTDLSLSNVLSRLDKESAQIGTEKQKKSPLGQCRIKVDELNRELNEATLAQQQFFEINEKLSELKNKEKELAREKEYLSAQLSLHKSAGAYKRYENAKEAKAKLEELNAKKSELEGVKNLDVSKANEVLNKFSAKISLEQTAMASNDESKQLAEQIKEYQAQYEGLGLKTQNSEALNKVHLMQSNLNTKDELEKEILDLEKIQEQQKSSKSSLIFIAAGAVAIIASIAAGIILHPFAYALSVAGILLAVMGQRGLMQSRINRTSLEKELSSKREKLDLLLAQINSYLTEVFGSSNIDLSLVPQTIAKGIEIKAKLDNLKSRLEQTQKSLGETQRRIDLLNKEISAAFTEFGVINIEGLKQAIQQKQQYDGIVQEIDTHQRLLNQALDTLTFEQLKKEAQKHDKEAQLYSDEESINHKLNNVIDAINETVKDIATLEATKAELEKNHRTIGEIQLELDEQAALHKEYANKLKAIELAKQKLTEVSSTLHSEFAPALNKAVTEFVSSVTDNRFKGIYIDKEMNIAVDLPGTARSLSCSDLSNGTEDLIYIAMRIALIDFLQQGNNLPIIFDDSFAQIDDIRLERILSRLAGKQNRQLLIFTCHNREKAILDSLKVKHNYIELE